MEKNKLLMWEPLRTFKKKVLIKRTLLSKYFLVKSFAFWLLSKPDEKYQLGGLKPAAVLPSLLSFALVFFTLCEFKKCQNQQSHCSCLVQLHYFAAEENIGMMLSTHTNCQQLVLRPLESLSLQCPLPESHSLPGQAVFVCVLGKEGEAMSRIWDWLVTYVTMATIRPKGPRLSWILKSQREYKVLAQKLANLQCC